jgi:signal transduction histidine kinase
MRLHDDLGAPQLAIGTAEQPSLPREDIDGALGAEDLAQIVHDLKDPLTTISLECRLLDAVLDDGAKVRRAIDRILRNVQYLDRMVQDLLDMTALDAGSFEIHRTPTELCSLLEDVVERMASHGRVFLDARERVTMQIDDLRIERVVANLLQNAIKYSPACTGIVVRLEPIAGGARVSVIDGGPGLSPEEATVVFDRYRRASTSSAHAGYGLGLYVSKQIITAHGGRIGVDTTRGVGSRFFFELPVAS